MSRGRCRRICRNQNSHCCKIKGEQGREHSDQSTSSALLLILCRQLGRSIPLCQLTGSGTWKSVKFDSHSARHLGRRNYFDDVERMDTRIRRDFASFWLPVGSSETPPALLKRLYWFDQAISRYSDTRRDDTSLPECGIDSTTRETQYTGLLCAVACLVAPPSKQRLSWCVNVIHSHVLRLFIWIKYRPKAHS